MSSRFVLHPEALQDIDDIWEDRKSTRLNSSHGYTSYAVFGLKKKKGLSRDLRHRPYAFRAWVVSIIIGTRDARADRLRPYTRRAVRAGIDTRVNRSRLRPASP